MLVQRLARPQRLDRDQRRLGLTQRQQAFSLGHHDRRNLAARQRRRPVRMVQRPEGIPRQTRLRRRQFPGPIQRSGDQGAIGPLALPCIFQQLRFDLAQQRRRWRYGYGGIQRRAGGFQIGIPHPDQLAQITQRIAIAGPPQQRLTIGVLSLVKPTLCLQRARQNQPGLRRIPADSHSPATGGLGLRRTAQIAQGGGQIMPRRHALRPDRHQPSGHFGAIRQTPRPLE